MIYTRLAGIGIVLDRPAELGAKIAVSGQRQRRQNCDQSSLRKNWSHFVMSLILYIHFLFL